MRKIENNKCWAREFCTCQQHWTRRLLIVLSSGCGRNLRPYSRPADTGEGVLTVAIMHGDTGLPGEWVGSTRLASASRLLCPQSSGSNTGLYELLVALPAQMQPHVDSQRPDLPLGCVWSKSLHWLVKIHEKLHYYETEPHAHPPGVAGLTMIWRRSFRTSQ